jgi:hypothetical protein
MNGVKLRYAVAVAGAAWAGLVLGHLAGYAVAYPVAPARAAHLSATGHGWLEGTAASVAVAVAVALVTVAWGALSGGRSPAPRRLAPVLAAVQTLAFGLVELAERGFDASLALTDPGFLIGLAVQVVVALAAAVVLALTERGVRAAARRLRHPSSGRARRTIPVPVGTIPPPRAALLVRARRRAPPASLVA